MSQEGQTESEQAKICTGTRRNTGEKFRLLQATGEALQFDDRTNLGTNTIRQVNKQKCDISCVSNSDARVSRSYATVLECKRTLRSFGSTVLAERCHSTRRMICGSIFKQMSKSNTSYSAQQVTTITDHDMSSEISTVYDTTLTRQFPKKVTSDLSAPGGKVPGARQSEL